MGEFLGIIIVCLVIVALIFIGGGIIKDIKVEQAKYEYKTELARMDHEREMYMLHTATTTSIVNTALVLGAGLAALIIFLTFIYFFDPTGVRQIRHNIGVQRHGNLERWETDEGVPILYGRRS